VADQARTWYGIELQSQGFADSVLELEQICERSGRRLVLRDWPFVAFTPGELNSWRPPNRLVTLEALEGRCELRPFAFVRDAIEVYLSRGRPEAFFQFYLGYVNALLERGLKRFRYEDFCEDPDRVMRQICAHLGLTFDPAYRDYAGFHKLRGDVQVKGGSRGTRGGRITRLPRRYLSPLQARVLDRDPLMREANRLLGYPTSYHDAAVPRESWLQRKRDVLDRRLRRLRGILGLDKG
jgi:hypothetical protein